MNVESIGLPKSSDTALSDFFDSITTGVRRYRFEPIAEALIRAGRPIFILETGCMRRPPEGEIPEADGCSSLVWDYVARRTGGGFITIDYSVANVKYAKSKLSDKAHVVCAESVQYLSSIGSMSHLVDLLYLDSMDWEGDLTQRALSGLHHAAELSAAWRWVRPGGLIAVDDCFPDYAGKHAFVKRFFDAIGIEPLSDDYIHVWRKPTTNSVPTI